jgi:membrane protein YqaA with SNARE-associated domain
MASALLEKILDFGIIGGGFVGLMGIFFPEFLYKFANFASEKQYDKKKDAWKYRLGGFVIVVLSVAFTIYDTFFR